MGRGIPRLRLVAQPCCASVNVAAHRLRPAERVVRDPGMPSRVRNVESGYNDGIIRRCSSSR
jgi:hypothetical protein